MINFEICMGEEFFLHFLFSSTFSCLQVGVIGNLVHSSPSIKREVLAAGALQPVIGLLRFVWSHKLVTLKLSLS